MSTSENNKRGVKLQDGGVIRRVLNAQSEKSKNKKVTSDLDEWNGFLVKMNIPFKVVEDTEYDENIDDDIDVYRLDIGVTTTLENDRETDEYRKFYEDFTEFVCIFFNKDGSFRYFSALGD